LVSIENDLVQRDYYGGRISGYAGVRPRYPGCSTSLHRSWAGFREHHPAQVLYDGSNIVTKLERELLAVAVVLLIIATAILMAPLK